MPKQPFAIGTVMERIREAVRALPPAVLFQLGDMGYNTAFEILVACIISVRTREEVTLPVALRLFARARTPAAMCKLREEEIDALIAACTFHETKAGNILGIANRAMEEFGGEAPCDFANLTSFDGVGPKCANLTLAIACGQPRIGVDIHVHRVTNRWGYVQGRTPEATLGALERVLPQRYWVEINRLLVPFGRSVCTGTAPRCSTCPVLSMCEQVDVTTHR